MPGAEIPARAQKNRLYRRIGSRLPGFGFLGRHLGGGGDKGVDVVEAAEGFGIAVAAAPGGDGRQAPGQEFCPPAPVAREIAGLLGQGPAFWRMTGPISTSTLGLALA